MHIDSSANQSGSTIGMLRAIVSPLPGQGALVGFCSTVCNPLVKHLSNKEDNDIHITSADVDYNNINIHSG